jgi:hypothetical protein
MTLIEQAEYIVSLAAKGLFQQHKYSNGYLSVGDSEIAEANIVIHAASTFLQAKMDVWAESPFKTHESNKCKHLDLLVDLVPTDPETSTILTIEAKRIASGEEDKKVEEILNRAAFGPGSGNARCECAHSSCAIDRSRCCVLCVLSE